MKKRLFEKMKKINAAFDPCPNHEIHRILEEINSDLEKYIQIGVIHDINGNKVGSIELM